MIRTCKVLLYNEPLIAASEGFKLLVNNDFKTKLQIDLFADCGIYSRFGLKVISWVSFYLMVMNALLRWVWFLKSCPLKLNGV